jgi:hypothetical protein
VDIDRHERLRVDEGKAAAVNMRSESVAGCVFAEAEARVQVARFPRAVLLVCDSGVGVEGFQAGPEEADEVLVVEDVAETG